MKISENKLRTIIRNLIKESISVSKNRKLNEMYEEDLMPGDFEQMPSEEEYIEDDYMPEDEYMSDSEYIEDDYMPEDGYIEDELEDSFDYMPGEHITDPNFTY